MSNIIDFEKALKKRNEIREMEETLNEDPDLFFAYKFGFDVVFDVVVALHEMGYNVGSDTKGITEIMLIEEALRSLVMRSTLKEYPFQTICENMFVDENGKELDYDELMKGFIEELQDNL